jgi:hypothetical protein
MAAEEESGVQGYVDGYREGRICGWAWRPSLPHETLTVEVLIDGVMTGEAAGLGSAASSYESKTATHCQAPNCWLMPMAMWCLK